MLVRARPVVVSFVSCPPVGFVWGDQGLEMDPDESVRCTIQMILDRFTVEPSAWAVVRWARANNVLIPMREPSCSLDGEVDWRPLGASQLYSMLHIPAHAGIYAFGRRWERKVIVGARFIGYARTGRTWTIGPFGSRTPMLGTSACLDT